MVSKTYPERGTGATSKQMTEAPKGSTFVWCNDSMHYPVNLARKLDRTDLHIVGLDWIKGGRWHGRTLDGVVVDHAARLTTEQWDLVQIIRARVKA